jgi:hypothetical protein
LFYVAAMAVREASNMKHPVSGRLPRTDQLKNDLLAATLSNVQKFYGKLTRTADSDAVARGPMLLRKLNSQWEYRKKRRAKKAS